ncbi:MAG: sigma 54-interacting transcriptional regulator [Planctomycetaceae bacterium]|nr:sigma 54-interacting transcriptional regulator [Planctomycetaceae bacterium]
MEQFQDVLLSVWQEACRHIEIGEATANIAPMLVRHIPVEQVLVRRIDSVRSGLETVAVGHIGAPSPNRKVGQAANLPSKQQNAQPQSSPANARTECSPAELESLLGWCRHRRVARSVGGEWAARDLPLSRLVLGPGRGDVLVGPLGDSDGHCGLLILVAPSGHGFDSAHADLVHLLLEPFSVAFENDLRLREMAALREAAEADKRSLLTKLGRKEIGEKIVGVESGLRAVVDRVELVARSDAPVLIFGETGTGKELIARAIHNRSARRHGPFDRVNCGAIPPELIDSQLFGHERGAFTGAVEGRRGWFERADGGTLFLDEIGELPPAAQVRMLRILQDGWMERVGGEKPINVDVRIVAATHRDLASMVAEGQFREDLWYRIAVFPIVLPPLRERREDIGQLALHFAERAATRFGLAPVAPTAEDLALLAGYSWPGNVRELAAVIDRAAILGDGKRLEVATALGVGTVPPTSHDHDHIPSGPIRSGRTSPRPMSRWGGSASGTIVASPTEIGSLDDAIRRHIEAALRLTHGCVEGRKGAAAMLQINPHTLRAKMRKLGIQWASFRDNDNGSA